MPGTQGNPLSILHIYEYNSSTSCHECKITELTMLKLNHADRKDSSICQCIREETHLKTYIFQAFKFDIENLIKSDLIHSLTVFTHTKMSTKFCSTLKM